MVAALLQGRDGLFEAMAQLGFIRARRGIRLRGDRAGKLRTRARGRRDLEDLDNPPDRDEEADRDQTHPFRGERPEVREGEVRAPEPDEHRQQCDPEDLEHDALFQKTQHFSTGLSPCQCSIAEFESRALRVTPAHG